MRCRTCQYPLWEIRERVCPECGSPFLPSQYDFVPNSVQFRCPHCGQRYYGTDERGHLSPTEFDCVACGRHLRMDDMVLLPTEGVREEVTRPGVNPWLEGEGSWLWRWIRTVGMALFSPVGLMKATPMSASTGRAARFCFFTHLVIFFTLYAFVLFAFAYPWMMGGTRLTGVLSGLVFTTLGILATAAIFLLLALLWGLTAHGVLRLTGPTQAGLARTIQALCYSSACNAITGVPCLGVYLWPFGVLWWWGSAAAMLVEGQRVRPWRAILATSIVPALILAGVAAMVAMTWTWTRSAAATVSAAAASLASVPPRDAHRLLLDHAQAHDGRGPDHAARILLPYLPHSASPGRGGAFPPTMLTELRALPADQREARLKELAEGVGADTDRPAAAHRVDDLVFMYTGVNLLSPQDPALWVIVRCPDPEASAGFAAGNPLLVVQADGTVMNLSEVQFTPAIVEQNNLRRSLGVPEIPDPRQVLRVRPGSG